MKTNEISPYDGVILMISDDPERPSKLAELVAELRAELDGPPDEGLFLDTIREFD